MFRFFVDESQVTGKELTITGGDVNHIKNVLRMKPQDEVEAVLPDGRIATCSLRELTDDEIIADVLFVEESGVELGNKITLYMGLPKFDKMELVIQKAVELGAYRIVPVSMKRTVVKFDPKKAKAKVARWQAIAEAASKQSKRAIIPEVGQVVSFKDALAEARGLDHILVPYECAEDITKTREIISGIGEGESVAVFIGPEGGIDEKEIEAAADAGAKMITLGRRILRTETAAISTLAILMFMFETP